MYGCNKFATVNLPPERPQRKVNRGTEPMVTISKQAKYGEKIQTGNYSA